MRDLDFISGKFIDYEIPKEQRYLLKYFKTDTQVAFLKYYLIFKSFRNFVDHTGFYCSERMLYKMQRKYKKLTNAWIKARSEMTEENMEMLNLIESGLFR